LIFALITNGRELMRRLRWELLLLALVVVISMLPSGGVFRWSFRWLPFVHVVLAVCAAEALQRLPATRARWNPAACAVLLLLGTAALMWLSHAAGPFGWKLWLILLALAVTWGATEFLPVRAWAPAAITFASLLATYLCIPPNCGVPRYNFDQNLVRPEPLDPQRLYLSIYPPPERAFRADRDQAPSGHIVRPGSTPMWGALRFINGYSPIRPAGVAREFDVAIHGDLAEWSSGFLLNSEAGRNGLLADLGVDGIIVARDWWWFTPWPEREWELAITSPEGRVYHRRGAPLPRARVRPADDDDADADEADGEELAAAGSIRVVQDSRHQVVAEVTAAESGEPTRVTYSRPFFRGYRATLNGRALPVTSWRGLTPAVDLPAGESGRLVLQYRPRWLLIGGSAALASMALWIGAALSRLRAGARRSFQRD
ncbi:MAG TPA: hypothetical protein VF551_07295, partial [Chthoniobacterales bacterium]